MFNNTFAFLAPFGTYVEATQTNFDQKIPFKDHWQFPILLDVICRKDQHHLVLNTTFSHKMQLAYFKALLHVATHSALPIAHRQAELIYLDGQLAKLATVEIAKQLSSALEHADHSLIIVLSQADAWFCSNDNEPSTLLNQTFSLLRQHPRCRLIVVANNPLTAQDLQPAFRDQFTFVTLVAAEESEHIALLKHERRELEEFHQVIIPDELLNQAYALAKRYLSTEQSVEKALLLLDSAAARASSLDQTQNQTENILTTTLLLNVLSTWTQIPATHLLFNQFKMTEFLQCMQQRVFGQDMGLQVVAQQLQQAQANLQKKSGPFCTLLLAGDKHTGKKTLSIALADQLFKQINLFYAAKITASGKILGRGPTLSELKFQRATDHRYFTLKNILAQTPYAVILIDNIALAANELLESLQEIIETGFWHDANGHEYDCRQLIILLSTTVGGHELRQLTEERYNAEPREEPSLLQLVLHMQDQKPNTYLPPAETYSIEELTHVVATEIKTSLSHPFLHAIPIVPFLPLNKTAIENIIRIKLKSLGKMLSAHHSIELGYAAEVIRYITNVVIDHTEQTETNIEKALQPLYFLIEQSIMNQRGSKELNQQLFLQLNETGHALRCDWISETETHLN